MDYGKISSEFIGIAPDYSAKKSPLGSVAQWGFFLRHKYRLEIPANQFEILFASGVLNLEPVDDSPNTATASGEQLADSQAGVAEIETVNTQSAAEDREQQCGHRTLELQH